MSARLGETRLDALLAHELVYLATPYSRYPGGIESAFQAACMAAGALIRKGVKVFSPIAHSHPIAIAAGIDPLDHTVWLSSDKPMMDASTALIVVAMPGWDTSVGVAHEIDAFNAAKKPVFYLSPSDFMG